MLAHFMKGSGVAWGFLAFACAGWQLQSTALAATVKEVDGEKGQKLVVMENETWKLTIHPHEGGRIAGLVFKPSGRDWGRPQGGMFLDHVTQQPWPGELLGAPYTWKILRADGPEASVELACQLVGQERREKNQPRDESISDLLITKTFTLRDADRRIEAKYCFSNPTDKTKVPVPWIQNWLNIGGDKENDHYYRAAPSGVQHDYAEWKDNRYTSYGEEFLRRPMRGWSAWIDHDKKEGCVFLIDYNELYWLYNCMGSSTLEWWCDPVTLEPGGKWETTVRVAPFTDLLEVSHADASLVGDLELKIKDQQVQISLSLLSAAGTPLENTTVELAARTYPQGGEIWREKADLGTITGKVVTKNFTGPKLDTPTQEIVVKAKVTAKGYEGEFERHIDPDEVRKMQFAQPLSSYRMPKIPKVKKLVVPEGKVKRNSPPHALVFRGLHYSNWGMDEALKALGVQDVKTSYHSIFVYGDQLDWRPGSLMDLYPYDVIVLGNIPPEALTETVQQMLKIYVERGGALLVLGGVSSFGHGEFAQSSLQEWLPVKSREKFDLARNSRGLFLAPVETKDGPMLSKPTAGQTPPAVFWYHQFLEVSGTVALKAEENPMLVTGRLGDGRIAVFGMTPCGDPPTGMKGFWEHPLFAAWIKETLAWLLDRKAVAQ